MPLNGADLTLAYLATIPHGRIKFVCSPCNRTAYYANGEVCGMFGSQTTFGQLVSRLTCQGCGRRVGRGVVTCELETEPHSREYNLRNMWGGVNPSVQLAAMVADREARGEPEPDW